MFQKFRKIHKKAPAPGSLFYLKNKRTVNSGEIPAVAISWFLPKKKKTIRLEIYQRIVQKLAWTATETNFDEITIIVSGFCERKEFRWIEIYQKKRSQKCSFYNYALRCKIKRLRVTDSGSISFCIYFLFFCSYFYLWILIVNMSIIWNMFHSSGSFLIWKWNYFFFLLFIVTIIEYIRFLKEVRIQV